jgi:hypothetical protein
MHSEVYKGWNIYISEIEISGPEDIVTVTGYAEYEQIVLVEDPSFVGPSGRPWHKQFSRTFEANATGPYVDWVIGKLKEHIDRVGPLRLVVEE